MELPQPSRPFGPEGRKATHDFLSLRTHSPGQHDPRPSSHGGSCLKTHNFLQPLEKDDTIKEDHAVDVTVDKPPPQVPPPLLSAEHVLPGGIGTYSISHISYFNQRMPKSEGTVYATPAPAATSSNDRNDENSNCSSYTAGSGGGITLWGESSSAIKGKAQKENMGDINFTKESMLKSGQWPKEMPSESSSNHQNNFSSRSSSQPPAHRSQSFLDMIKSAKGGPPTKEEEDDEYLNAAIGTSHRGELRVKVDGKRNTDQKANTPRSKHSATEQRRRCKINDRFQALREIIPHGDQKRDKASFLLEVIEYIQFLQEKVSRYESPYPPGGWSGSEPPKPTSWRNSSNLAEGFPDQPRSAERPVLTFGTKEENLFLSTTVTRNDTIDPAGADIHRGNTNNNNAVAFNGSMDQRNTLTNKAVAPSVSLVPEVFPSFSNTSSDNGAAMHSAARKIGPSDADNKTSLSQLQLWHSRQHQQHHQQQQQRTGQSVRTSDNDLQQHQELAVEGGTINISSIYSQGLLNTLTQALQSSGVDLSQASISVQVDVGKRAGNGLSAPTATTDSKDGEVKGNGRALVRERGVESSSGCGDPDQATTKRLKKTVQPH